ncbi:transporter [Bacillus coahuilensis p1.1.43]|uniref:Transporter n=1 Tax=Bacillus coahuilensis p1.1.43 TaxID=1150625 RepID=A0A147K912_9BACI|nr:formate/nitrite transporter family protein [Bacillus coahuilensis]KUP06617.1 transporter [Bacillus coahuilensis p1.1.43]
MEAVTKCIELAVKKKKLLETSVTQYMIRAALAGVYIGFAIILCFKLGEFFHVANSPATYLMSAIFFGIALILIIYGEAELFTGNTMYFTMSTLDRKTSYKDLVKNWLFCYSGNVLGAILFTGLIVGTGLLASIPMNHLLFEVVEKKMHTGTSELFFRAILCNWIVCLSIFIPMQMKEDMAKIFSMFLLVFTFFLSGYEHSIANFVLFFISLAVPHPGGITIAGFVHNIVPVTIGNIIGGGFFMGVLYYYVTSTPKKIPKEKNVTFPSIQLGSLKK